MNMKLFAVEMLLCYDASNCVVQDANDDEANFHLLVQNASQRQV